MEGDSQVKSNSVPDGDVEMTDDDAVKQQLTSNDPSKVKYVNSDFVGKNGDAKVDIENIRLNVGMGKDELMKYANEPFWIRTRMILFVLFWICWIAMLVGAIVIIVLAPRCSPPPQLTWWQKSVFYHVYVPSFKDGDGDGIGDLKGLASKLDYFVNLGVKTLLLSPIFKSPMKDNGYDISDYNDIDPKFGTLHDFEDLLSELKKKDMKVIIDFVPNHSSNEHPWFNKSEARIKPYDDYYIWAKGKDGSPPNNWISVFGGSAWKYSEIRKEYYLHQFSEVQPDFNLRNEHVREEMQKIIQFWLDKGVDGFRVDATPHFFEDKLLRDEPKAEDTTAEKGDYDYLDHKYTKGSDEVYTLLAEWRELLNNYTTSTGSPKILLTEAYDTINKTMKYYGTSENPLVDIPFNFKLLELNQSATAEDFLDKIKEWMSAMPKWAWPNWVLGNHDNERMASRVGPEIIDGIFMAVLLNKGTPITYYGDELGMENAVLLPKNLSDVANPDHPRDAYRVPMQWSNDSMAGFTNGTSTWIPIQPDYPYVNVESEFKDSKSHLNIYKKLVELRDQPAIMHGDVAYPLVKNGVFSMLRIRKGSPGYLVVLNMGVNSTTISFLGSDPRLPDSANVEVRSSNLLTGPLAESGKSKIQLSNVKLEPNQSVVLSFVPKFED
uniref:alpha-glucosidase n=1 Tax=Hadrurus spadix TaxID=141984 RepID=A0A1W7RA78_9SCOR